MSDNVATQVIREVELEKADRGNFESLWTQVARRIFPRGDNFQGRNTTPGERRTEWQFDSKPALALERYASVFLGMTMPPSEKYHTIKPVEESIRKDLSVKQWCEDTRDRMFKMRYANASGFVSQINEVLMQYGAFGTGMMFIDDRPGQHPVYKALPLEKTWIREGENGHINQIYRQLDLTAHKAIAKFGAARLPEQILKAVEKQPNKTFAFYHRITPREYINKNSRFSIDSMEYQSDYVCEVDKVLLESGGYRSFPVAVARCTATNNEVYARSPAMTVLADIKLKNEVWRTVLRSSHRMAEPTMLLADDAALAPFQMQPGYRNRGYLKSNDGTPLAQQLPWEGDLQPAMLVAASADEDIKDAFLMRIFELMLARPDMTATEVLERLRERGMLLTPSAGRFFSEFIGSMGERETDILAARGQLSPMPELLEEYGGDIELVDDGPLARAQKAERAIGFDRTLQQVLPLAERNPNLLLRFKDEEIVTELADIHGMPSSWLHTTDEYENIIAQEKQNEVMAQATQAAPGIAGAAKDAAHARLLTRQAGSSE